MKIFSYVTILFIISLIFAGRKAVAVNDKGQVYVTQGEIDLGEVHQNVDTLFYVVNHSDKPLVIKKVESDCSCTKVSFSEQPIMMGDSTAVQVRYKPRRDDSGVFYKSIRIFTTHRSEPIKSVIRGRNMR